MGPPPKQAQFAYRDIVPGNGHGQLNLGKSLELLTTLYSLMYISLVRQEYIDAIDNEIEH